MTEGEGVNNVLIRMTSFINTPKDSNQSRGEHKQNLVCFDKKIIFYITVGIRIPDRITDFY